MIIRNTTTGLAALALAAIPLTSVQAAVKAPPAKTPVNPAAVDGLAKALIDIIGQQPQTATSDDIEAQLSFGLDNAKQTALVQIAAIDQVAAKTWPRKVKIALANLRRARLRIGGLQGTGGILSGSDPTLASGPTVGAGGGTDYTSPQ